MRNVRRQAAQQGRQKQLFAYRQGPYRRLHDFDIRLRSQRRDIISRIGGSRIVDQNQVAAVFAACHGPCKVVGISPDARETIGGRSKVHYRSHTSPRDAAGPSRPQTYPSALA
jgi:hypothetical protein